MLVTDDDATYLTTTRDVTPERMLEFAGIEDDASESVLGPMAMALGNGCPRCWSER